MREIIEEGGGTVVYEQRYKMIFDHKAEQEMQQAVQRVWGAVATPTGE